MLRLALTVLLLEGCSGVEPAAPGAADTPRVLVFSKTAGYRHASIADGVAALREIGAARGSDIEATYAGGSMGDDPPAAWSHAVGEGRAAYTALGHTEASCRDHLGGAVSWAGRLACAP